MRKMPSVTAAPPYGSLLRVSQGATALWKTIIDTKEKKTMLTSKQRAQLRSMASQMDTIMQIGKGGVGDALVKTVSDALKARELIKMRVLETAGYTPREIAEELAAACDPDVVTVIGSKVVLYKRNEEKPKIELPRA